MATEAFIQCRVALATKAALRSAAERQQLTESALFKRMLDLVLHTAGAADSGVVVKVARPARQARLYVRLATGDRQLLQERSAARYLAPATYASNLLRALGLVARIFGLSSRPVRPCTITFSRTSAPMSQAGIPAMPHRSLRSFGDGPFLDLVSYGRWGPGQHSLLLPAQIEQIARTVRRTPEVMVKISGSGQSAKAVASHFKYLARQEFEIEMDDGEHLKGRGSEKALVEDWALEVERFVQRMPPPQTEREWLSRLLRTAIQGQRERQRGPVAPSGHTREHVTW